MFILVFIRIFSSFLDSQPRQTEFDVCQTWILHVLSLNHPSLRSHLMLGWLLLLQVPGGVATATRRSATSGTSRRMCRTRTSAHSATEVRTTPAGQVLTILVRERHPTQGGEGGHSRPLRRWRCGECACQSQARLARERSAHSRTRPVGRSDEAQRFCAFP